MTWFALLLMFVVPWIATFLGSYLGTVMELKSDQMQRGFLGFAGGVMIAASIWSLIIPAFDGLAPVSGALITTAGFALGVLGMLALDKILPHQHVDQDQPEGAKSHLSRPMLLVMAVALHNIPEGISLGIVMVAAWQSGITPVAALVFAAGLALQNFPEGMAVVVPLKEVGMSKRKIMKFGTLASFAEPVAALVGIVLSVALQSLGSFVMPIMLTVAAGAMVFITVEELIPASQAGEHGGHGATYGFLLGFWIMAVMGILAG